MQWNFKQSMDFLFLNASVWHHNMISFSSSSLLSLLPLNIHKL
uniref:Uncharacterized protein n=1 Tax=Rhizophora mucronata TaxID=61149 RepID=A0A2P2LU33_RHIMU